MKSEEITDSLAFIHSRINKLVGEIRALKKPLEHLPKPDRIRINSVKHPLSALEIFEKRFKESEEFARRLNARDDPALEEFLKGDQWTRNQTWKHQLSEGQRLFIHSNPLRRDS